MASQKDQQEVRKGNGAAPADAKYGEQTDRPDNPLSEREMEVAALLATRASNAEIARELIISPHTVKVHVRNVYEKLGVNSRTEASMVLLQRGWLMVPGVDTPEQATDEGVLPEPEPLADATPAPALWQRVFLVLTAAVLLLLLVVPGVMTRTQSTFDLLSDGGRTVFGQSVPLALPRWSARTPLPFARSRHAVVSAGDGVYVLGGENASGQTLDSVTVYDLEFNEWQAAAPLPEPLANLAAAELDGAIYVAGGSVNGRGVQSDGALRDCLLKLDVESGEWAQAGFLPATLAGAGLVSYDGALYLLGGWDGEKMRDEVWRWAPQDGRNVEWELFARMATPAAFFGSVVAGSELYVMGGYDGQRELADANALDLSSGEWRQMPPMSTPRGGLTAVYDGMAVFALGGGWTKPVDTHERYDSLAEQWSNFPSPIQGDWRHFGAVTNEGRIWQLGGWSGGYLDVHQEYQSAFRALLPVIQSE